MRALFYFNSKMPKKQLERRPLFQQKPTYDWQQNDTALVVQVPCDVLQQKHLSLLLTDVFVRVANAQKPSEATVLDLFHEIDFTAPANRALLRPATRTVELVLTKKTPGLHWEQLEIIPDSREALAARRNEAQDRLHAYEAQQAQKQTELRHKLDKETVEEQMRLEGQQRDILKARKEEEKRQAEDETYALLESKYGAPSQPAPAPAPAAAAIESAPQPAEIEELVP